MLLCHLSCARPNRAGPFHVGVLHTAGAARRREEQIKGELRREKAQKELREKTLKEQTEKLAQLRSQEMGELSSEDRQRQEAPRVHQ